MGKLTQLEKIWNRDVDVGNAIEGLQNLANDFLNIDGLKEKAAGLLENMPSFVLQQAKNQKHKVKPEIVYLRELVDSCEITQEGLYVAVVEKEDQPGEFYIRVGPDFIPGTVHTAKGVQEYPGERKRREFDARLTRLSLPPAQNEQ